MKNNLRCWKHKVLIFSLIMIAILMVGCRENNMLNQNQDTVSQTQGSTKPSAPMNVSITITDKPILNQPFELIVSVTPLTNAPNTTISVLLPEGFLLEDGDLSWNGDLSNGEIFQLKTQVRAVKKGEGVIEASAKSVSNQNVFGKRELLFVYLTESDSMVSDVPFGFNEENKSKRVTNIDIDVSKDLYDDSSDSKNDLNTTNIPLPIEPDEDVKLRHLPGDNTN